MKKTVHINKSIPTWARAGLRRVASQEDVSRKLLRRLLAPWTCVECPQPFHPHVEPYVRCDAHRGVICSHHAGTGRAGNLPDGGHLICTKRCRRCNRESKRFTRFGQKFKEAEAFAAAHGLEARFTTLTRRSDAIRHEDGIDAARQILNQWIELSEWRLRQGDSTYCPFREAGYVGCLAVAEIKSRPDGTCHPHIHAITFWKRRPDYKAMHCLITGSYQSCIDNIDWGHKKFRGRPMEFNEETKKYLAKYMAKSPVNIGNSDTVPRFTYKNMRHPQSIKNLWDGYQS